MNPFQTDFEEQSLQTLYRKMKKTAMARFNSAERLRRHQTFTLWTLSLFSAGLIVLSAIPSFGIQVEANEETYTFLQFILSLFVLVISLLLASSNYAHKAEKTHRCALEINDLCHEILPKCKENLDDDLYHTTRFKYSNVLNSYDNHEDLDFDLVKIQLPEEYSLTKKQKIFIKLKYWLTFWIHALLILILLSVFFTVFIKKEESNQAAHTTPASAPR
ncbi:SLATT domain-containing protein [Pelagicoccus sp. SDUM812003]|uniref:SLATT domain-containing protein n=1 Tax=Pelagicoccus sp. SDUM812003 TaxID=3041267 RepID=UPI00280E7C0C|nr:SLATT domain-containing protein [Pelagicoccus sp. SDUM812003]MDQ8205791.1 SLATT domain-containing protein [Pelagicoccus sp. SDUM812003]